MLQLQPALPVLALLAAGLCSLVAAFAAWHWRDVPGARPLALCALATALWSFGYTFELGATTIADAVRWATVQYLGIVTVPGAWLIFSARYTGRDAWLVPRVLHLFLVMPAITLLAVSTNSFHGLFWADLALLPQGGRLLLDIEHGPLFWVHTLYSYSCLLGGSFYLLRTITASPSLYRSRLGALLLALAAPLVGNALYLLNLSPLGPLDLTPLAFSVSFIAITWSIVRLRLFNLIPLARSTVLEQMTDAVAVLDADDRVVDLNAAALRRLGHERQRLIGRHAREVFARWPDAVRRYEQTVRTDEELQLQQAEGSRWFNVRISPLTDNAGQLRGRLVVWRDITPEKQTLAALVEAKEAAEAASKAKSAFLANMSHELRTPLSAVLGYAQLMRLELDNGVQANLPAYLGAIDTAGDHLLRLISNLLQIARIEAGRVELDLEQVQLDDLLAEVVSTARPLVDRKQNRLVLDQAESLGTIVTDRVKLRQILFNLLDNAAKFTEQGTITLCVQREREAEPEQVRFVVSDTGVGIAPEELPQLFALFTEPDVDKRRRFGGTGIGLALSRQLCERIGGEILVGPPSDMGSTFIVRLPTTPVPGVRQTQTQPDPTLPVNTV